MPRHEMYIILFTALAVLLASMGLSFSSTAELIFFSASVLIIGIPHGATDHIISSVLENKSPREYSWKFAQRILAIMGVYAVVWFVEPLAGLAIFLLLSYYHFGQSQLYSLKMGIPPRLRTLFYMSWGIMIVNALVGFHGVESYQVVQAIVEPYGMSQEMWISILLWSALAGGIVFIGFLISLASSNPKDVVKEIGSAALLLVLFHQSTLLVSFAIYFAFWHSLKSMLFEVKAFQNKGFSFSVKDFFVKALPLSLISYAGIGLLLWVNTLINFPLPDLTVFFVMLSILTLPHVFTIDELYRSSPKSQV